MGKFKLRKLDIIVSKLVYLISNLEFFDNIFKIDFNRGLKRNTAIKLPKNMILFHSYILHWFLLCTGNFDTKMKRFYNTASENILARCELHWLCSSKLISLPFDGFFFKKKKNQWKKKDSALSDDGNGPHVHTTINNET